MMSFLASLESTGIATWVRESPSLLAYPLVIALHTVGMAFVVGLNVAIDLRILGVASRLPLAPMAGLFPFMWAGFGLNAATGALLLMQGATRFSANPIFFIKLGFVALAIANLRLLRWKVFRGNPGRLDPTAVPGVAKALAGTSLVFWAGAVVAGRLTAYALFGGVE
jgi:hypothetical protein